MGASGLSVSKGKTHFGNFGKVGRNVITPRSTTQSR